LVEFRVLGDLQIRAAGQRVAAGHARQRSVLAVLVLDIGRVVAPDQLIDRVWGQDPPPSVRNVLYGYVAKLRTVIDQVGEPGVQLARRPGGYLLQAGRDQVDLYQFRRLTAQAAGVTGDDQRAEALLGAALSLWHGPALAGLDSPWLAGMRDTLELQRLAAVLDRGDIALRQGRHNALISDLAEEAVSYPADERLIGQLMLALYRSGRQAEALRWFEQTRQRLTAEFGASPGSELQALHQRILRADPSLAPTAGPGETMAIGRPGGPVPGRADEPVTRRTGPAPRELPADLTAFTGRAAELDELDRLVTSPDAEIAPAQAGAGGGSTAVISAVSGTAGVGKTALAVHWAHRIAGSFPDGQLYVNLRGYDPGRPVAASDALAGFLRALGVAGEDIPAGEDERAARYRSLLAGRRVLVLADNASEVAQVRPLLPGSRGCVAVVTSRDSLAGLVARDGATRLDLDLLPHEDAVSLLRALIGARADAEPDAVGLLVERCARLPLALRVAAELALARPGAPLADLAGELADQRSRLDLLDAGGDPRTAVRAVFSWSYQHLDAAAARNFRLLGLHPGTDFEVYAIAALTGTTVAQARQTMGQLARAHLIQPAGPGRYGMHDLLRAYAAEQAAAAHDGDERRAALTRLFDHYLHTAATAMDTLFPAERGKPPPAPSPATPAPPVSGPGAARAWLDAERANLIAVAVHSAGDGSPGLLTRLAAILHQYLQEGGHYPEAVTIHTGALHAARHAGDRAAEATALASLSDIDYEQSRYHQANDRTRQALALFREIGDRVGEASAVGDLGLVDTQQGRYQQAASYHRQALALCREIGDRAGEARALSNLGSLDRRQGRYQQATGHLQQALALFRETGQRRGEAYTLARLGVTDLLLGRHQEAIGHMQSAVALFRETGNQTGEAEALARLADAERQQGHYKQATGHLQQALTLCRATGRRADEATALNVLGEILLAAGNPGGARGHHTMALGLATQIGDPDQQAHAHHGLALACWATADGGQARRHWQQALVLYAELGAPEADQVRAELAAHGGQESTGHLPFGGGGRSHGWRNSQAGRPGAPGPEPAGGVPGPRRAWGLRRRPAGRRGTPQAAVGARGAAARPGPRSPGGPADRPGVGPCAHQPGQRRFAGRPV
jgi:DNA-binding SARP family transcriptional activator/tetratricopeptide (TPR) repeat protein